MVEEEKPANFQQVRERVRPIKSGILRYVKRRDKHIESLGDTQEQSTSQTHPIRISGGRFKSQGCSDRH
jgi:hypothetical protein